MAEELSRLLEAVSEDKASAAASFSSGDLSRRLHSDSVKPGFQKFYSILNHGIKATGDGQKLGFESWNRLQIQSVASIAQAVALATRSLPVEHVEPIVVSTLQKCIEFATCFLEKSELNSEDLSVQNNMLQLLEIAIVGGTDNESDSLQSCLVESLMDLLPNEVVNHDGFELESYDQCLAQGFGCSSDKLSVDKLLTSWTSVSLQPDVHISQHTQPFLLHNSEVLVSFSWHYAAVHLGIIRRLIGLAGVLVRLPENFDEKVSGPSLRKKLSLCSRILKLLKKIMGNVLYVELNSSLLEIVASFADTLSGLFRCRFDFANSQIASENSYESLVLAVLEEFLDLAPLLICDKDIVHSIRVCVVASVLGNLDSSVWRYDKSATYLKPPLVYFPRCAVYILKSLEDINRQGFEICSKKELCSPEINIQESQKINASCHVQSQEIPLCRNYTHKELLKILFPSSGKWLENLMNLLLFLHSEGMKMQPKLERCSSSASKLVCVSETETTVSQEDEVLFGNLFSEGGRSIGSNDGYESHPAANSGSGSCNMPLLAASELLTLLKSCIFSSEEHAHLYKLACSHLCSNHIDILLGVLNCRSSSCDDADRVAAMSDLKKVEQIQEICFQLLRYLISHHSLSNALEEYLVQKISRVENGVFVCNDQTLALLAICLTCKRGLSASHLRSKVYREFVGFIVEKGRSVSSACLSVKEVVEFLPSIFHMEIILMAFHMCSENEKVDLAEFTFSSLKAWDTPPQNSTQLSCWGLLVSRLIILLRHIMFNSYSCPASLLADFRFKLGRVEPGGSHCYDTGSHHLWASLATYCTQGLFTDEEPAFSSLVDQLVDFVPLPASILRRDSAKHCLLLSWNDISVAFRQILSSWEDKEAVSVGDLIIERYIMLLCWDIPAMGLTVEYMLPLWTAGHAVKISNMEFFVHFCHLFLCHYDVANKNIDLSNLTLGLVQRLHDNLISKTNQKFGWNFTRNGQWLSLILSLLNSGLWRYCMKNDMPGVDPFCVQLSSRDCEFLNLGESMVYKLVETNKVSEILRVLSSLLVSYADVYDKAFLCTLNENQLCGNFSPLLLLKHTEFDECERDEVTKNVGNRHLRESVCNIISKLDAKLSKKAPGILSSSLLESLFHGFPSNHQTWSGILVSSVISIRRIISVLDLILKVKGSKGSIEVEPLVLYQILNSVTIFKYDRVFQSVSRKCEDICLLLSTSLGRPDYSLIFLMRQMEGFLHQMKIGASDNPYRIDLVITKTVDIMDNLRKDPLKMPILKFHLGYEDASQELLDMYSSEHGDLLVLITSLDISNSEAVNVKVLNFFVELLSGDVFPNLKQKLQKHFLDMELPHLSRWLEKRLLGFFAEDSNEKPCTKDSNHVRDSTMNFILCLASFSDSLSRELLGHVLEALLISLETAFISCDIYVAKAYFHFIMQLLRDEASLRALLHSVVPLMEKMTGDQHQLQGLKFLFSFLETILGDSGSSRMLHVKSAGKSSSVSSGGTASSASRILTSGKNSETLVLSANQEGRSASFDCDAMSIDEDEDDGTSDGEVASIDKEEEEDTNSERALASKVCTFTSSGSNFMEQHWYFCYTCDLTVSKGCCSVCAKVCHRGHRVVYSRSSRFFCDCGAGGVRGSTCQCLKPRKFTGSNTVNSAPVKAAGSFQSLLPFSDERDQLPDSDSDGDEDIVSDTESVRLAVPGDIQGGVPLLYEELDVEGLVLRLCTSLLPSITCKRKQGDLTGDKDIGLGKDKVISYGCDLLQLKKSYKSGSLDLKIKTDYSNSKELKSLLGSGSLVKSLLSVSGRGRLAVGEGDRVAIVDVGQMIGHATISSVTADKTNVKPLSKNNVRFEIVHLMFNPLVENYLVVAGLEDCQVFTVNTRGEVTDRLVIELALQGAYIRRVEWVPGSQVQLMVVTNKFVKIYDLSQDNISPLHYFTLPSGMIVDATLSVPCQGRMLLVVLPEFGSLYKFELCKENSTGTKELDEKIDIQGKDIKAKGASLFCSSTHRLFIVSYQDGTTLMGRLNPDATSLCEVSVIHENEQEGKGCPAGLHHWKEMSPGSGLFVCFSSMKQNSALALSMQPHDIVAQNIRHVVSSNSPVVGVTSYKPISKDKFHCLVLHEDGSLQIYALIQVGVDAMTSATSEKVKKLGTNILSSKAYSGANPEFPLDFFEKTVCITSEVKVSCDSIRNGDSEGAKQRLAAEDGFLESASPDGFKITVSNSNPDTVMVGIRVHVGNSSATYIPADISIFQRVIKLDEGMRCWYDIPFTVAESLLADEEFTISVGPTFSASSFPRIDSLEVYGRPKDEFGWKEKMDALLEMEARALGCNSWLGGSRKKMQSVQSAPIEEQVVADGLKLLSTLYTPGKTQGSTKAEDIKTELSKVRCKKLLEIIFESDREPLLQAAACRVLQAIFPKREIYYQVKDTMRLLGVVNSTAVLLSRLGAGGSAAGWIIEEFTAQMHAVSKIALHRGSNLTLFLEMNGSQLVDGLMQILWGILEIEPPDTQTMNNIVMSSVDLIYCYAECLAVLGKDKCGSVSPAVAYLRKLLFYPNEAVQTASSLAISSRLLQVPFPKQTMLAANEDAADNATSASAHADIASSARGNAQVMIEEDSITSSVQYCCDGCSTVPIQRTRWHCTICPDFDLCEACYQVLDADHLPEPHTRDHPMTAIPIEMETLGGDGHEIHFSADDLGDSNIMQVPTGSSMQISSGSIHVLEPNELEEFPSSNSDPVSISASKRAVNSLLLSELLAQLSGWMDTTSGVQAIPVMQLFYRLSSAVGGPFVNSSKPENLDLEKLIRWFLDEIKLNKPFVATSRSSFGEVTILVFMFFTLMLRNWHQPGSDASVSKLGGTSDTHDKSYSQIFSSGAHSSPSCSDDQEMNDFASQLLRACNALRQQPFLNYLMDILLQLVHIFKAPADGIEESHSTQPGSGCGALLTVRRELPAGNYSPFFSDSYAKAHRSDIFVDYHRLLLENTFRLVYCLVRPEKHDKTGDKEKVYKIPSCRDLKLDGYQDVLCSYINNHNTSFIRRYARRLFLHLCGSKSHYYSVRDSWQFSSELKSLHKHISKSGGLLNPISYERSVKVFKCLSTMADVAASRPRNWQKHCLRHGDVLPFLVNWIFCLGEESVVQTLRLLSLAFYTGKDLSHSYLKNETGEAGLSSNKSASQSQDSKKKKKSDDGVESGSDKSCLDMEAAVDVFADRGSEGLIQFIDCFLLEWNSNAVRAEAKTTLFGIWHHGKHVLKEAMLTALLQRIKSLPSYGQNITEYTELLTLLIKAPDVNSKQQSSELLDRCLTFNVVQSIFETLHTQNELLANHPNSRIYNTLSSLVEFDGYYLESEPCVACSFPEVSYSRMKLESLKSESKFTDNRIIVKCTGSFTIQCVTMNVHDARKSKSVKVLNLYYNNRPVSDLSELKNNWSLWKRAKSCHLSFNQTELKVDFPIPITACNFMIELDSFYENLQASSMEPLQCPRCSRPVTDRHGICSNCHENAYQCRQCRNINYENLDSFLCNECGYSKYGRFEFSFLAKPSFTFDTMENDDDMKRGLAAIESESENAHRRYQQLLGFKKPLLKIVNSVGENEMDSQQKDSVQQMMVSLPGPSMKVSRKIALLGVLYGEKCKAAFDSVSKSVQTLQGLRRVLMNYLYKKYSDSTAAPSRLVVSRSPNSCYGCATTFVTQCLEILQLLAKHASSRKQLVSAGILTELFENNIHQGPKSARVQARAVLCVFSEGDMNAVLEVNKLIQKKVLYCLEHHRSMDISVTTREEMLLLSEVCSLPDEHWESRLRIVFQLLFTSIKLGSNHPAISEHVILPCLRIVSQACTPPKPDTLEKETAGKSGPFSSRDENSGINNGTKPALELDRKWDGSQKPHDIQLLSYSEWEKGASYLDFIRRQYKVSQTVKGAGQRSRAQRHDYLTLKYVLRWKRRASRSDKNNLSSFELGSWVSGLILSACSQSIRSEMCILINLLCAQSPSRRYRLLNLLLTWLPETLTAAESATEYFELLFKMIETEDARLFLTARGCLTTICKLVTQEVSNIESLERSLRIDISQGFILHKLIELLDKFLEVPNIRARFMRNNLLSEVLEALIVIRGLVVQKTKLISDCNRRLKDLLDGLLQESSENKRQFIRACICGLQIHGDEKKGQTSLFILEQLCNLICPSKPEPVYLLILNKAHTQEEFIRGSMTKNPYSSAEVGPLMRDVKNKICHQLDMLGLVEDDYGMELLVAGNIISLDLSVALVYEQVWRKSSQASSSIVNATMLSSAAAPSARDCPPMIVTYRLQGLDGEATEPMIKELEEDREETQDPEVEFAIAGAVREYGGLEIILDMIKRMRDDLKSNHEQFIAVLNLLGHCCKIRENRTALLRLGALGLLLETARRAFSVDAMEPAEGILLIVESLTLEANDSDNTSIAQGGSTVSTEESGASEQAKKIVLMFLERLSQPMGSKKSSKQQRNTEMVARILPYLTYGEPIAMEALIQHFDPYFHDWKEFDRLQKQHEEDPKDEEIALLATKQRFAVENFVRVSESLKTSSCGERLKDIILEKGITGVAVKYLRETFAVVGQPGYKSSSEWVMGLRLSSVPLILSMLRGLSMGHMATQMCIDEGSILPVLHALEGVSGENEVGARAENLLDTLSDKECNGDGFLGERVRELRNATKDEMRRRALKKREELLQGLGMRRELSSDGGERIIVSRPNLEGLEDVEEEEDGFACMVCREGYRLRANDLLGVYSYSKRVNLGVGTSGGSRGECVYTTVSHFNMIHFQCHQEAKRADAGLKAPKKEWDGATLRNNETLCNSLFPVRGPCVPLAQYVRYVDLHWDNLNALGRADGSRLRLLIYDIVLMLARFATGASFSTDSKGGGKESNSKFLPFMVQMARHLLDHQGSSSHRRTMARAVSTYLASDSRPLGSQSPPPSPSPGQNEESVQFMMVNSLLCESYEAWLQHRRTFLLRGIYHAYMQHKHSRSNPPRGTPSSQLTLSQSESSVSSSSDDLLSIVRPMLVYTGLIEQLQHFFKVRKPSSGSASTSKKSPGQPLEGEDLEPWEVSMKEKLLNMTEMVGFSKELLSWIEDMSSAGDLQEAFDVIGALTDVFSGGFSSCEEFVRAAINAGKG